MDYHVLYKKIQKHGSGIKQFCDSHDRLLL